MDPNQSNRKNVSIETLQPTQLLCNILWLEILTGMLCLIIMQQRGTKSTRETAVIVMFLLCILQIFTHCLTDVVPMGLENKVPCLRCNINNNDGRNIFHDE